MLTMLHYDLLNDPLAAVDSTRDTGAAGQAEHVAFLKDRPYEQFDADIVAKVMDFYC